MEGWWIASYVVLWLLVLALCVVVVALARQIGTLHLRLGPRGALEIDDEGPALGEAFEPLATADLKGKRVEVGGPGTPQLLLFVSPGCGVCEQVLPSLPAIAGAHALAPVVIADSDGHETARAYAGKKLHAPVVADARIPQALEVPGTPYVVVTDRSGAVRAKGTVNNLEQMEGLIDTARRRVGEDEAREPS